MGGSSDRPYDHTSAASSLSAMLDRRIACAIPSIPSCTSSPDSTHSSLVGFSPHTPAVPRLAIPVPRSAAPYNADIPSPHSSASGIDSPASFHNGPFYRSPMTPGPDVKPEDVAPYIPYDQPYNNSWVYQDGTQYVADPVSYFNASSCVDAANIIRTMRTEAGAEYQDELVCRLPRQDFHANNPHLYAAMDRYANPQRV
jgi:hypothetical protein